MTVFAVVVACLLGAALLFVVPPLFSRKEKAAELARKSVNVSIYKQQLEELDADLETGDLSQDQYDKSRAEIERRLLEDAQDSAQVGGRSGRVPRIATAIVVMVALPLSAILLYGKLGNPNAMKPELLMAQPESPHGDGENVAQQIEMMVAGLSQRLQENPQDIEGWVMLGRSMSVLGRYDEAVIAYERALQFAGDDANVLADYADAMAMASGESLEGRPMAMLEKALTLDPNNQKALWLAGTGLFESGDFVGAINYWGRLRDMLPPDSEDVQVMNANIAEAERYRQRQLAGEFGTPSQQQATEAQVAGGTNAAVAETRITGRVSIVPELMTRVAPEDTLFVFARSVGGPPMPLAIIRTQASELPLAFTLDESMAMLPGMSLANYQQVEVGARISRTGNAMPLAGDLQGSSGIVTVGSNGLEIVINSIVP